jgi:hypothetical protein
VNFSLLLRQFEDLKIFPVEFIRGAGPYALVAVDTFAEISTYHNSAFIVN